jgi:methylenetetrahydrofolate reductase (NADPH)
MPILNLGNIRRQGELIGTDVPAAVIDRIMAH